MKPYFSLLRARFRTLIQYRAAAIAGFATQLFWGMIKVMVMEAFYRNTRSAQPMDLAQVVTYTWLGQAFFALLPFSANPDPEIRTMMRSGAVAYELARPLDLYSLWYVRAVAARVAPTLLRCIPMFLVAVPFLGMGLPPSPASAFAFLIAICGAVLLASAFATLITTTLLWTVSGEGIARIVPSAVILCSGMIVPIPLLPDWAQGILRLLPFAGMADNPFRLYSGHLPPESVFGVLLHQIVWTATLVMIGRLAVAKGVRSLVVQGG